MPRRLAEKIRQYAAEICLCWEMGADWSSKNRLAAASCFFHIANGLSRHPTKDPAREYNIHLSEDSVQLFLRTYNGDLFVFHEVFLSACYRIPPRILQPSDVRCVVDLGAHIGLTTLYLSTQYPRADFVCVEPNPVNIVSLRKNVEILSDRVTIIEGAVSDANACLTFDTGARSWEGRLIPPIQGGVRVRCFAVEDLIQQIPSTEISLLKVDIEGQEGSLFRGRADWLRKVRVIICELHGSYQIREFARDMDNAGFRVYRPGDSLLGNVMPLAVNLAYESEAVALQ